jgi:hypothetical protein
MLEDVGQVSRDLAARLLLLERGQHAQPDRGAFADIPRLAIVLQQRDAEARVLLAPRAAQRDERRGAQRASGRLFRDAAQRRDDLGPARSERIRARLAAGRPRQRDALAEQAAQADDLLPVELPPDPPSGVAARRPAAHARACSRPRRRSAVGLAAVGPPAGLGRRLRGLRRRGRRGRRGGRLLGLLRVPLRRGRRRIRGRRPLGLVLFGRRVVGSVAQHRGRGQAEGDSEDQELCRRTHWVPLDSTPLWAAFGAVTR